MPLAAFGQVAASLRRSGRKASARAYDAMIAAVALANELPLFTCNPADFTGIEGLTVVADSPSRPANCPALNDPRCRCGSSAAAQDRPRVVGGSGGATSSGLVSGSAAPRRHRVDDAHDDRADRGARGAQDLAGRVALVEEEDGLAGAGADRVDRDQVAAGGAPAGPAGRRAAASGRRSRGR